MKNELAAYVAQSDSLTNDVGTALLKFGAGGLALGGLAFIIPWVTLPMLLVVAVLIGGYLKFKS